MDIYQVWGFSENPFSTTSLSPDYEGNDLLTGRDTEIKQFLTRLYGQSQIVTVEGDNGIGKTSIINVGIFRATLKFLSNRKSIFVKENENPLFIPCIKSFQLHPNKPYDEFEYEVYAEIAQTIIKYSKNLKEIGAKVPDNLDEVNKWLNSPFNTTYQGSIGFTLAQVSFGTSSEINSTDGFEKNGLKIIVQNWLNQIFPSKNTGGVVCIIDNFEILEKSVTARKVTEYMRDTLLSIHGIRWVFCGSLGIVSSMMSSPRLEGFLLDPIEVSGINSRYLKDIFQKRISKFKTSEDFYLPITSNSFTILYDLLRNNLRNTLSYTDKYCLWINDFDGSPQKDEEKDELFFNWLIDKSNKFKVDVEQNSTQRTIQFFSKAVEYGGCFGLGDFEFFDFNNQQTMKTHVNELEKLGLAICAVDENDNRRKALRITSKGWLTSYAIKKNK